MLIGGLLASTGYALAPVSTSEKIVYISSVAAADDLTQRQLSKYPYFIRTGWSSSQPINRSGNGHVTRAIRRSSPLEPTMLSVTRSFGGFQRAFEACGGKIIQKIWPPIGTKDFGPYIPTIKQDADAIFTTDGRSDVAAVPQAAGAAGNKKPVLGGGTSYDEFVLPFMGDEVIGHVSALKYSAALDTPENAAFVKAYRTKYGKVPCYYSETNYTTAR